MSDRLLPAACLLLLCCSLTACGQEPVDFALAAEGGTVTGPRNSSASATLPPVANDGRFDGYAWAYLDTPLVVRLAAPRTINTVELYLYHEGSHWYRFTVAVSADGTTWTEVAHRTEGKPKGRQIVGFDPVTCQQVKITFTDTSVPTRSYHVREVGVYLLADPAAVTPLQAMYREQAEALQRTNAEILLDALGPGAQMTRQEREAVGALEPGQRILRDLDGDGDPDVCDLVDTDPRHTVHPMLVRIIDDDDDMGPDGLGDEDSDCYVADWKGDGSIDRAVDYWDYDGDGDADRMDIYYAAGGWHVDRVEVVVIRDVGDDDKLWWTRNYEYDQYHCQWNSDFNGDEIFCMFGYDRDARQFTAFLEEPFTHHDLDGDGVAEMTLQFMGEGLNIRTLRYSFDADNDTHPIRNRRDYDFSLNCVGLARVPDAQATRETLRNGQVTGPYLDWPYAREVAEAGDWKSCRLCWDEIDNNVNPADRIEKHHERWEGVGGYPMNEGNKRWETDKDYSGKMELYYWNSDRRLHLLGAETGHIEVDYNHDTKMDARITYEDRDGDGYFDHWSWDGDADGVPEYTAAPVDSRYEPVPIDYEPFTRRYRRWVQQAIDGNSDLIDAMKQRLGQSTHSVFEDWWHSIRPREFYAADKLGLSAEARRYYLDLTRQELYMRAEARFSTEPWWEGFGEAYESGQYARAAQELRGAQ